MPQKKVTTANNRKSGMTVQEIRDALIGVNGDLVPEVSVTWGGKIRSITVQTQP